MQIGWLPAMLLGMVIGGVLLSRWERRRRRGEMREMIRRLRELETDRRILRATMEAKAQALSADDLIRLRAEYEARLQAQEEAHRRALAAARRESVAGSRAVLKGKMAEQMAPLLPGFDYLPADARFLGDPVDYVVFDGYSACKDGGDCASVEIVILDVKQGQARLSRGQRLIAEAVASGRVRFEVVHVRDDGRIERRIWPESN